MQSGTNKTKLLFDADILIFQACLSNEHAFEWADNAFSLNCHMSDVTHSFDDRVRELTELVLSHYDIEGDYELHMCITSLEPNFRKGLYPDYKANRQQHRRPLCWLPMREWVREHYTTHEVDCLEADDVIGLMSDDDSIIISGDKDFKTIPCRFYDMSRNEYYETTPDEAVFWHLVQTLIGDSADNYKGCQGIGIKRATAILEAQGATWETVLKTFLDKGHTEEYALSQAQVAYILHKPEDYDFDTGGIRIWQPEFL